MRATALAGLVVAILLVSGCAQTSLQVGLDRSNTAVFINTANNLCWSSTTNIDSDSECWDKDTYTYSSPAWISTNEVVAVRQVDPTYYEIVALDLLDKTVQVIAQLGQQPRELQVSNDGKAILFLAGNNGYVTTRTATASASSNTVRVYEGVRTMSWLGDAKTFMYVTTNNRLLVQKRTTDGSLLDAKTILETDVYAAAAVDDSTALVVRKGDGQFELQQVDIPTSQVNRITSWSYPAEGTTPQLDAQLGLAWNRRYAFIRFENTVTVLGLQTDSVISSPGISTDFIHWLGDSTDLFFRTESGSYAIGKIQSQASPSVIELRPVSVQDLQYRVTNPNML